MSQPNIIAQILKYTKKYIRMKKNTWFPYGSQKFTCSPKIKSRWFLTRETSGHPACKT